eukprot:318404_1
MFSNVLLSGKCYDTSSGALCIKFKCKDCGTKMPGTNCAYELSRQKGWTKKNGCYYHCSCGYPIRAKEIRNNIFSGYINSDKNAKQNTYIYCETVPRRRTCLLWNIFAL